VSAPSLPSLLVSSWQLPLLPTAGAGLSAAGYLLATRRVRAGWPAQRSACFLAGLATILVSLDSGLGRYDDQLLSAHMVQHMGLLLLAPPLLLAGRPAELVLRALAPSARPPVARALGRLAGVASAPVCLALFVAVVLLTHLPGFYDATLTHPVLHDGEHAAYLLAGGLMWWPLLDGDPVPRRRLGGLGGLLYLLATMVPMAIVGAYLNRQLTAVYPAYVPTGRALGISAVRDQQYAGAIMWVLGDLVMVVVGLWAVMSALLAEERRQQARDRRAGLSGGSLP
jgi:cytochrome c oxidase assembly factor CtaG